MPEPVAPPDTVLAVIRWHVDLYGYPPTVREIAVELDVANSTVQLALDKLEQAGRISRKTGAVRARSITIIEEATTA